MAVTSSRVGRSAAHLLTVFALVCLAAQQGWKPRGLARAGLFGARQRELAAFAVRFARHPVRVGAVAPTSARTAAALLNFADLRAARLVVELGPGTGAITAELLQRVGSDTRIVAVEVDPVLAARLGQRFTDKRLTVINDTAEHAAVYLCGDQADVIVCAVPLTTVSRQVRETILAQSARILAPGGMMLAIQYSPARQSDLERTFRSVRRRYSARNIPPAFLYACAAPRTRGTAGC
jgi:phospholipid N-methyltransferase